MSSNEVGLEFLSSYGTLQLEAVQMATFGRQLAGTADTLRGFGLVSLRIDDEVAAVRHVPVVLQSGIRAWAYVDARYAPSDS